MRGCGATRWLGAELGCATASSWWHLLAYLRGLQWLSGWLQLPRQLLAEGFAWHASGLRYFSWCHLVSRYECRCAVSMRVSPPYHAQSHVPFALPFAEDEGA